MESAPPGPRHIRKIIRRHNKRIKAADEAMLQHLNTLTREVRSSVWVYIRFYTIILISGIILLVLCLNVLWETQDWKKPDYVALSGALIGLCFMLLVAFRNPIRLFRQSLIITSSLNLVYSHFSQQLTQADTRFRLMAEDLEAFDQEELNVISENINVVLEESIHQLRNVIEELE